MKYDIDKSADETVVNVSGQLTVSDQVAVGEMIQKVLQSSSSRIVVDLKNLEFMDSSGLGMLLVLHDKAKSANATVIISRPEGKVRKMLELACFDTLFTFQYDD